MKNKKIIAMVAGLAALTVAGGSFAAYAAESEAPSKADYSYTTGQTEGAKNADTDEQTDKTGYSYVAGQAKGAQYADAEGASDDADKTEFSFNTGKANGTQYAPEDAEDKSEYSYVTGQSNGEQFADEDEQTDKADYSYVAGQANGAQYADAEGASDDADKTEFSFNTGKINGTQYAPEADSEESPDKTDYSFNAGQQNAQSRNDIYTALPEGGTKEDAEAFYEQNDVGGGAWVDGAYDESAKADYGYAKGQQRGSSYAQETDGVATPDKSGYSYSTAKQSYEQNHATWNWGE